MKPAPSLLDQQEFYDARWREFSFAGRPKLLRAAAILDAIASTGLEQPRIVDLGCGAGWLTGILAAFGPTVGIELSPLAVREATRKYPNARFQAADVFNWKYPPRSFDIVVSQEVLEHVEDQQRYLDIARDLLCPGGYLILTTPNATTYARLDGRNARGKLGGQPIESWLSVTQVKCLLASRFDIRHLSTVVPTHGLKGLHKLLNSQRLEQALGEIRLARTWTGLRLRMGQGRHILAVAQRR